MTDLDLTKLREIAEPPTCPNHREVQHRDRNPPWCPDCGWNPGRPAVPPRQIDARADTEGPTMTDLDLTKLREIAEAAMTTPGPWSEYLLAFDPPTVIALIDEIAQLRAALIELRGVGDSQ